MSQYCRRAMPWLVRVRCASGDLQKEPLVFFARRMGPLAFDRTIACCQGNGFRPNIVQDAPQWPTLVRLVAAGLGVSLAPACVASVAIPGASTAKCMQHAGQPSISRLRRGRTNPSHETSWQSPVSTSQSSAGRCGSLCIRSPHGHVRMSYNHFRELS